MTAPSHSFLCLRHGATDWNRQGLFQGRTDNPLNEDGIAQAHAAARLLQNVELDHVVASPLIRALATAEIIAASLGKRVTVDQGLIECDFGNFEGRRVQEIIKTHGITTPEQLVSILPGEAWATVSQRALHCVGTWQERHPNLTILFVCHDAVMRAMAQALCRRWFNNRHAIPFRFAKTDEAWNVEEL